MIIALKTISPSHATFSKVQTYKTKKSKCKEFRPKNLKSVNGKTFFLPRPKFTKLGKTSCQDKKKNILKKNETRKTLFW